ncbi:kinase-like protein [Clavulina sp. PMI_390]|nr:kinase-like protein [Clavulina sp. PMI_390]
MAGHAGTVVVRELVGATYQQKQAIRREWIQLLHREAITHSQLQHPNVLPFWGIYYEDDESYPLMVLPYLERGSLEEILNGAEQSLLDSSVLTTIVVGMARGVVYLHSRTPPIIHGDLHPGNILIDELNNPVLCDFGRSRIRHEVSRHLSTREEGGRIRFLAPELLNGQTDRFCSCPESDIFGLAMTYLNAWTGQVPFAEIKNELRVASVINRGERPIEPALAVTLDPMIKTDFWTLLVDMWAHEPARRPSSIQVLERVEHIFENCKLFALSGLLKIIVPANPSIFSRDDLRPSKC